jgi:phosphoglycerate dehydrogenase-like enzyme
LTAALENDELFGEKEFAMMKDGAIFMNLARGKGCSD